MELPFGFGGCVQFVFYPATGILTTSLHWPMEFPQ
jgi:hypothetical protein